MLPITIGAATSATMPLIDDDYVNATVTVAVNDTVVLINNLYRSIISTASCIDINDDTNDDDDAAFAFDGAMREDKRKGEIRIVIQQYRISILIALN